MARLASDRKDEKGLWVASFMEKGVSYQTKTSQTWQDMKSRCVVGSRYQQKRPSYIGCTVANEFLDYQYFANWYTSQIGYGQVNYDLDKDILFAGNKVYGEDFCCLIPTQLNSFLSTSGRNKGLYPTGVHFNKCYNQFMARVLVGNGERKYLGSFLNVEDAFEAYKKEKENQAVLWASRLEAGEFVVDPRVIEALKNWKVPEEWK